MTTTVATSTPDYSAIKAKQNAAWASGDYARIGATLQIVGESLAEAMDLRPGSSVLDVAAGNGNATLAFARRMCTVTSTDYVDALLARGRARAEAEALDVTYEIADAEQLPFNDRTFDAVVSTFGVMFAPNQEPGGKRAAPRLPSERQDRPGELDACRLHRRSLQDARQAHRPAPGVNSPALWGTEPWIAQTFGPQARAIAVEKRRSSSVIPRPNASWMSSAPSTAPSTRRSWRSIPTARPRWPATCSDHARFNTATDGSMRVPRTTRKSSSQGLTFTSRQRRANTRMEPSAR